MISVLHLGKIEYGIALELQQSLVELRQQSRIPDVLLLLEHPPVITLGRNASENNLLASPELLRKKGVELFETKRGGDITFHGPGQLVGYPIFDLRGCSPRIGAVEFVRKIEEALIRTCGDLGIPAGRLCGLTGVWTEGAHAIRCGSSRAAASAGEQLQDQRKIAAIGIHISRGVTSHGFALNVSTDLDQFKLIVPCGIADRPVTSIANEFATSRPVPSVEQIAHTVSLNFGRVFARQMLWLQSLDTLLRREVAVPPDTQVNRDSTTIGVPVKIPKDLQELRREQGTCSPEDEISVG